MKKSNVNTGKINTGFDQFSDTGFESKAWDIYSSMNGNVSFPAPDPDIPTLLGAITAYREAMAGAATRDRTAVVVKDGARIGLTDLLQRLGFYVSLTANGDTAMLTSSGYDVRKMPEPKVLPKPENMQLADGINPGELYVSVDAVFGAKSYVFQYTTDPLMAEGSWVSVPATTRSLTLKGLEKAKVYWCRVVAVGSKGQIVYSDPLSRVVQ